MPSTPVPVRFPARIKIEGPHAGSVAVNEPRFNFRRDTMPVAIYRARHFVRSYSRRLQFAFAQRAGNGFDVTVGHFPRIGQRAPHRFFTNSARSTRPFMPS